MASFDVEAYLKTFLNWELKLNQAAPAAFALERMERLLHVFGYPQTQLRFAHVAGTKGKGSTCAFLASILRAAGYRVGLYTSPHLHSLCERIRILMPDETVSSRINEWRDVPSPSSSNGSCPAAPFRARGALPTARGRGPASGLPLLLEGMISWVEIEGFLRYYYDDIEKLRADGVEVTFYEIMTALAAAYFAQQKVDIVVLETGLGGRLDATNVFETSVCGITPIGFDHMNILGMTLEAIAGEKAGIIRFGDHRVSLSPQPPQAMAVLKARCQGLGINPTLVGVDLPFKVREVSAKGVSFDVHGRRCYDNLVSPLTGAHQAQNAALAIAMAEDLETFGFMISAEAVRAGIASVEWPARFEHVADGPITILDCAHTRESAQALAATFCSAYPDRKAVVVLGMSADKDAAGFIQELAPLMQALVLTKAAHARAAELSSIPVAKIAAGIDIMLIKDVPDALDKARHMAGAKGMILVTGSVFVCAEAKSILLKHAQ